MVKNKPLKKVSKKEKDKPVKKVNKKKMKKKSVNKPLKKVSKKTKNKPVKKVSKKKVVNKVSKNKPFDKASLPLSEEIPKKHKRIQRIKSGIKGFDRLIGGGFDEGSINLILGGSGSGKSIFAMQFLIEGIKKGEAALYITFEESKDEFFRNMMELGWDLGKYEKTGKLIFLEYSPEKVRMMIEEGGGAIESVVYKNKVKRMVIDSLNSFSFLFDSTPARRQGVLSLFDIIRKWDTTSLFTLEKNPIKAKSNPATPSEIQSDSLISLYFAKVNHKRQRFVEVLKMRGTNHTKDIYPFQIGKSGVVIGSKPANVNF